MKKIYGISVGIVMLSSTLALSMKTDTTDDTRITPKRRYMQTEQQQKTEQVILLNRQRIQATPSIAQQHEEHVLKQDAMFKTWIFKEKKPGEKRTSFRKHVASSHNEKKRNMLLNTMQKISQQKTDSRAKALEQRRQLLIVSYHILKLDKQALESAPKKDIEEDEDEDKELKWLFGWKKDPAAEPTAQDIEEKIKKIEKRLKCPCINTGKRCSAGCDLLDVRDIDKQ